MNIALLQDHSIPAATEPTICAAFGQRLAFLREQSGVSHTELSLRLGIPFRDVKALEAGSLEPDLVLLKAISHALRTTVSELLRGL